MRLWLVVIGCALFGGLSAQNHSIERVWFNNEKTSKIQIFKGPDNIYYGKIIWLRDPKEPNGQARVDVNNPKEHLRTAPLMNLVILKGFKPSKSDAHTYEGGTIYDPKTGKTYCGSLTVMPNILRLRGHICGWSWLGRSTTWSLAE